MEVEHGSEHVVLNHWRLLSSFCLYLPCVVIVVSLAFVVTDACACRICGAVSLPEDVDNWNRWEKSNGRQWYLPECLERVKTGVGWL